MDDLSSLKITHRNANLEIKHRKYTNLLNAHGFA